MDSEFEVEAEPAAVLNDFDQQVIKDGSVHTLSMLYREAYDDVEHYKIELSKLDSRKRALAEQLCKLLLAEGYRSIKTEYGSFGPKVVDRCSIIKGKEELAFEQLEEAGLGGLIKRKVEWQSLNKAYRDGELKIEDDSNIFSTWQEHTIAIRRTDA